MQVPGRFREGSGRFRQGAVHVPGIFWEVWAVQEGVVEFMMLGSCHMKHVLRLLPSPRLLVLLAILLVTHVIYRA